MREPTRAAKHPLRATWNVIGTLSAIVGFANTVDRLVEDGRMWNGFILKVVESYRSISEPIMDLLFGWLPFHIPYLIGDVFFLYVMIGVAGSRVYADVLDDVGIFRKLILILQWPLVVRSAVQIARLTDLLADMQKSDLKHWASWLGAIVLGCMVLLAINPLLK